jgi:hypothetical protein
LQRHRGHGWRFANPVCSCAGMDTH